GEPVAAGVGRGGLGTANSAQTEVRKDAGADGRFTARGITVDAEGRVYLAGGPNGLNTGPQVFRVADDGSGFQATLWADATDEIVVFTGFNLGGIVLTADRRALVVAQGTTGQLWRFDSVTGGATPVATGGADLTNADGLVRQGNRLTVVRNFTRKVATLRLAADGTAAQLIGQVDTAPDRVLTTAKVLRGRILYVDSKFDETVGLPPYEVVTDPTT
ncbi:gluconolaconase, partial [Tessaracoccus lubricantis]